MPSATSSSATIDILQIVPAISCAEAGVWFSARGLVETLARRRLVRVCLAGPVRQDSGLLIEELRRDCVNARSLASIGPGFMELPIHAAQELVDQNPNVLHVHGLWRPVGAYISSRNRFSLLPRIISPHGMLSPWALRKSAWKKQCAALIYENWLIKKATAVHALSEAEYSDIRSFGYLGPICIVPNGINITNNTNKDATLYTDQSILKLLFLGRINQQKGLHLLIPALVKAFASTKSDNRWVMQIAGFGDSAYENSLREMVASAGLTERVIFLGPVFGAAKDNLLKAADAFVLASYGEAFPMALLEAGAHSLPILCTAECNLPELYPAGAGRKLSLDIKQMAQELVEFFSLRADERKKMGDAARMLVQDRYQWDRVAAQFEAVYAWAADTGPVPSCVILD